MKKTLVRRKKKGKRSVPKRYSMTRKEIDDLFYMYSSEDLPEIESDLSDMGTKPEISRDYYL